MELNWVMQEKYFQEILLCCCVGNVLQGDTFSKFVLMLQCRVISGNLVANLKAN